MKYTRDYLYELESTDDLIVMWNEFCSHNSWYDDEIYDNSQYGLEMCFAGEDNLIDLARSISKGSYNYGDAYYKLVDGNIVSFTWLGQVLDNIDVDELLNWLNEREEE